MLSKLIKKVGHQYYFMQEDGVKFQLYSIKKLKFKPGNWYKVNKAMFEEMTEKSNLIKKY